MLRLWSPNNSESVPLEISGRGHDHKEETISRGLCQSVKQTMKQILVSNLYIRPSSLHEILINDPYNFSSNQVPIYMLRNALKSIRKSLKSSQGEFNVGGL